MENYEIQLFDGKKAPPRREIKVNTLFVPEEPSYPGYDLFYYDKNNERFYFIRMTTDDKPVSNHVVDNDKKFAEAQSEISYFKKYKTIFLFIKRVVPKMEHY